MFESKTSRAAIAGVFLSTPGRQRTCRDCEDQESPLRLDPGRDLIAVAQDNGAPSSALAGVVSDDVGWYDRDAWSQVWVLTESFHDPAVACMQVEEGDIHQPPEFFTGAQSGLQSASPDKGEDRALAPDATIRKGDPPRMPSTVVIAPPPPSTPARVSIYRPQLHGFLRVRLQMQPVIVGATDRACDPTLSENIACSTAMAAPGGTQPGNGQAITIRFSGGMQSGWNGMGASSGCVQVRRTCCRP